jgi:hypothetical protein
MNKRENNIEIENIKKNQAGTTHLYLGLRIRMRGVMPLLPPFIFSQRAQRQTCLFYLRLSIYSHSE